MFVTLRGEPYLLSGAQSISAAPSLISCCRRVETLVSREYYLSRISATEPLEGRNVTRSVDKGDRGDALTLLLLRLRLNGVKA